MSVGRFQQIGAGCIENVAACLEVAQEKIASEPTCIMAHGSQPHVNVVPGNAASVFQVF